MAVRLSAKFFYDIADRISRAQHFIPRDDDAQPTDVPADALCNAVQILLPVPYCLRRDFDGRRIIVPFSVKHAEASPYLADRPLVDYLIIDTALPALYG